MKKELQNEGGNTKNTLEAGARMFALGELLAQHAPHVVPRQNKRS